MYLHYLTKLNTLRHVLSYISELSTKYAHKKSMLGAILLFLITIQCLSGVMLSFSYIPESMIVPFSRDEEDHDDLYTDDFFWIHERLVDLIFITMYLHLFRKLSNASNSKLKIFSWVSGATLWLLLHMSIFLGLCLCCTHLSDITLTIASNIIFTICFKIGKFYWWIFTNQTLNTDTLVRLAYFHYIVSIFIFFYSYAHAYEMHYDWKDISLADFDEMLLSWVYFIFKFEISFLQEFFFYTFVISFGLYKFNEALSYEIFMWGDIGMVTEPRFLGVAPHWYFRSYMGWLIVCPQHYLGIYGLVLFMLIVYFQPFFKKLKKSIFAVFKYLSNNEFVLIFLYVLAVFLASMLYTSSTLPYGKFYNRLYGNGTLLWSYFFVLFFLTKSIEFSLLSLVDDDMLRSENTKVDDFIMNLPDMLKNFVFNLLDALYEVAAYLLGVAFGFITTTFIYDGESGDDMRMAFCVDENYICRKNSYVCTPKYAAHCRYKKFKCSVKRNLHEQWHVEISKKGAFACYVIGHRFVYRYVKINVIAILLTIRYRFLQKISKNTTCHFIILKKEA